MKDFHRNVAYYSTFFTPRLHTHDTYILFYYSAQFYIHDWFMKKFIKYRLLRYNNLTSRK